MTQGDEGNRDSGAAAGSVGVLEHDPITSIIPLDELEAQLDASYSEEWAQASNALAYSPRIAEVTQDLLIPEHLLEDLPELDEPTERSPFAAEALRNAPEVLRAPVRKGGRHRVPTAPHALKGRTALVALAAGAAVTGAFAAQNIGEAPQTTQAPVAPPVTPNSNHITVAPAPAAQEMQQFANGLAAGKARKDADDKAIIDAMRPKVTAPIHGATVTSNFGTRWGALHGGLDLAAPLGTPMFAAEDGVVVDAGPASGFGLWIRIKLDDGTMLVYGHMFNLNVRAGQHVRAGDLISWVGNNGFSTGPHLHFEVHSPAGAKVDPQAWLAERGVIV